MSYSRRQVREAYEREQEELRQQQERQHLLQQQRIIQIPPCCVLAFPKQQKSLERWRPDCLACPSTHIHHHDAHHKQQHPMLVAWTHDPSSHMDHQKHVEKSILRLCTLLLLDLLLLLLLFFLVLVLLIFLRPRAEFTLAVAIALK